MGNTDEMLVRPQTLEDFASHSSAPPAMWEAIREIAAATRECLGEESLAWLQELRAINSQQGFVLVHGTPESCWHAPAGDATDAELRELFRSLGQPTMICGHTHRPFLRHLHGGPELLINTGSVGIPYDGDSRASYLLLEGRNAVIRRVEYNVKRELQLLAASDLPGAQWTAKMLRTSSPQMP
jgi:diadenosine tetraphosphatase ApaH/serine/threonine PP2A family protein phosphatase